MRGMLKSFPDRGQDMFNHRWPLIYYRSVMYFSVFLHSLGGVTPTMTPVTFLS
jgi:hypothetical protein